MAKNSDPLWMEHANIHKGALTKKADKAGESVSKFAKQHEHSKGKTGKQARLAETFAKARKG